MKRPRLIKTDTQGNDYSEHVISAPLNDRTRTLSGVEGYTSQNGVEVNINSKI